MATVVGTIAGIGEKVYTESGVLDPQKSTNVIYPEFDAKIRNFVLGGDAIIEGLTLRESNGKYILSGGSCAHQGIVGTLPNSATFDNNTIYALYHVNHSKDGTVLDAVEFTDEEAIQRDVTAYSGNVKAPSSLDPTPVIRLENVPEEAEVFARVISVNNSKQDNGYVTITVTRIGDNANLVISLKNPLLVGATIKFELYYKEEIQLSLSQNNDILGEDDVSALCLYRNGQRPSTLLTKYPRRAMNADNAQIVTQSIMSYAEVEGEIDPLDNSNRVASRKFVQDVIDAQIDYNTATTYVTSESGQRLSRIDFVRKAKMVVGKVTKTGGMMSDALNDTIEIPEGFLSKTKVYFTTPVNIYGGNYIHIWELEANSKTATHVSGELIALQEDSVVSIGWETK